MALENLYENIDQLKASKMKENLINDKDKAFLSKTLATINTQAPIEIGLDDLVYKGPQVETLWRQGYYDEMKLSSSRLQLGTGREPVRSQTN